MASLIRILNFVGVVALFGCGTGETDAETRELDPCETTTADYTTVGAPFIQTWYTLPSFGTDRNRSPTWF